MSNLIFSPFYAEKWVFFWKMMVIKNRPSTPLKWKWWSCEVMSLAFRWVHMTIFFPIVTKMMVMWSHELGILVTSHDHHFPYIQGKWWSWYTLNRGSADLSWPSFFLYTEMMVMRSHGNAELMTSHDHPFRDYREKDGHGKSPKCQTHDFTWPSFSFQWCTVVIFHDHHFFKKPHFLP